MNKVLVSMTFDPAVAREVGTDSAIILQNIVFWIAKNRANGKHNYEGTTWTYNSHKAFLELFSWLSEQNLRTCIKKLIDKKYLIKGNFNKASYDRTTWYALGENYQMDMLELTPTLCENQHIELLELTNGSVRTNEPIPYINTDIKPNISLSPKKKKINSEETEEHLEILHHYNMLFRPNNPSKDTSWYSNASYWLKTYSLQEIKLAITNWSKYDHWSKKDNATNGLVWLFRTRNKNGQANYIDELLALGGNKNLSYEQKVTNIFNELHKDAI
jgi:hypothetical protein